MSHIGKRMIGKLKNYITKPRLTREQKKFVLENLEASQQEIKDLIAKYFYLKDDEGTYDLRDETNREDVIKIFKINSIIDGRDYDFFENYCKKYCEVTDWKSLDYEDKNIYDLMKRYRTHRYLRHTILNKQENRIEKIRFNLVNIEYMHSFEFLEKYFNDKHRKNLSLEDQRLFDVIKKYSNERKLGQIMLFMKEDDEFNLMNWKIGNLLDEEDYWDDDRKVFHKGVEKYEAQKKIKVNLPYYKMDYKELKKERTKLYKKLEAKEQLNDNRELQDK